MSIKTSLNRPCDTCSACCQGYLVGHAYGQHFSYGKPCKFLKKTGCSIYQERPSLCSDFLCSYKYEKNFTLEMRPDISKVICMARYVTIDNKPIKYLEVVETDVIIPTTTLQWLIRVHEANLFENIRFTYDRKYVLFCHNDRVYETLMSRIQEKELALLDCTQVPIINNYLIRSSYLKKLRSLAKWQ